MVGLSHAGGSGRGRADTGPDPHGERDSTRLAGADARGGLPRAGRFGHREAVVGQALTELSWRRRRSGRGDSQQPHGGRHRRIGAREQQQRHDQDRSPDPARDAGHGTKRRDRSDDQLLHGAPPPADASDHPAAGALPQRHPRRGRRVPLTTWSHVLPRRPEAPGPNGQACLARRTSDAVGRL